MELFLVSLLLNFEAVLNDLSLAIILEISGIDRCSSKSKFATEKHWFLKLNI